MEDVQMVNGLVLIDAPASALNNAGIDPARRDQNVVIVKKIRYRGQEEYPYVSGQAFKRWWRDTILQKFDWNPSPIFREEKVAYTEANPIKYEEDDIFGYMLAPKQKVDEIGMVSRLSYRRVAPLKCTPLISIFGGTVQKPDQGFFMRGEEAQAEPVPFQQEFYSTVLKGAFSLMLSEAGIFYRGRAKDLPAEKDADEALAGKKKDDKTKKQIEKFKERVNSILTDAKNKKATIHNSKITLPLTERKKRIRETLLALSKLTGGAKGATYLTDVSPRFIITGVLNCANHIFMDVIKTKDTEPSLDIGTLTEIVKDYKDNFLSPIYIGLRRGFFGGEEYKKVSELKEINVRNNKKIKVEFGTPREAIKKLVDHIDQMTLDKK
jgi:CRISPR-associated protein Cst2